MTMKESAGRARVQQQETRQRKQSTKKMEEENKKMEIRLQELKMAMNREKEEREVQDSGGGGFWGKGQTGSLLNYKVESQKKPSKVKKVGVLKDDPIVIPKRPAVPGTMAYLAQHDPASGRINRKSKGPRCGQCEDRPAAVTCQECGEDYCTKCFAVFHLKGALRKHRTTPISTLTPRSVSSARQLANEELAANDEEQGSLLPAVRPGAEPSAGGGNSTEALASARDEAQLLIQEMMRSQERQPAPASNGSAPKDVQRLAVRFAEEEEEEGEEEEFACDIGVGGTFREPEQKEVADSAIGTDDPVSRILLGQPPHGDQEEYRPDIHFTTSLSYAERLLLKQNRRRQLERLEDGAVELRQPIRKEEELRHLARQQALQTKYQNMALELETSEKEWEEEHVNFQALCDLTELAQESSRREVETMPMQIVSHVTIQEDDFTSPPVVAGRPPRSDRTQLRVFSGSREPDPEISAELHRKSNGSTLDGFPPRDKAEKPQRDVLKPNSRFENRSEAMETAVKVNSLHMNNKPPMATSLTLDNNYGKRSGTSKMTDNVDSRQGNSKQPIAAPSAVDNRYGNRSPAPKVTGRRGSGAEPSRPSSRRETPRSVRRPDLSRPVSRKASDSARRIHNLTSQASGDLRAVTKLRNAADFRPDAFLTLGLGDRSADDVTSSRPSSRPTSASRLANRFYTLGPRSWRPDSSLLSEAADFATLAEPATLHDPSDDLPSDLQTEVAALEAMAVAAITPPASVASSLRHSFVPPSRASTTLTAVTSRSMDGHGSIVIDGDDFSSFDRMQPEEDEEEEERDEMMVLERGISSQREASRSFFLNDVDEDALNASEDLDLQDSLEMGHSFSLLPAVHDDSDSLDSLDTARYDDAGAVRDLQ